MQEETTGNRAEMKGFDKIGRKYNEPCFICDGTGHERFSGATCAFCGGKGFISCEDEPVFFDDSEQVDDE